MKLIKSLTLKIIRLNLILLLIILLSSFIWIPNTLANLTVKEIEVSLGHQNGELKFFPDKIELLTGKTYKLLLNNPSSVKHYFTSME